MSQSYAPDDPMTISSRSVQKAADAGVIMETVDDSVYLGQKVEIGGVSLLNFGGCSYLGLEQRSELSEAVVRAVKRFGTQFSISRAYLQSPLYRSLESALDEMIGGGNVLVTPSTTLGHLAALPVLIRPGDGVVIDQFAHASLQMATSLLRNTTIETVRHNRMELLDRKIAQLVKAHRRVWYIGDGLYSMLGDFAPIERLAPLLDKYPQLRLYMDDAHSTSWLGKNGRGYVLDRLPNHSRVFVALSLNKAFSAGGGALVFPTEKHRALVRRCGGPMLFSGPVPPPMLAAALASAELHLRPEFAQLQRRLLDRIRLVHDLGRVLGVPFASSAQSPIFFVRCGAPERTFALVRALREKGIYVCASVFPAVPQNQSGVRFTVSLHNTEADIEHLVTALGVETGGRSGWGDLELVG
jgi:7-keto-8-aminopelargonate synthetase-like enzyme